MLTVPIVRCTKECDDNKHMRDTSDDKKIITVSQAKEFVESSCPSQPTTRSGVEDIPDWNGYYPFIPGEYTPDWSNAVEGQRAGLGCVDIPIDATNRYVAMSYYYTEEDSIVFYAVRILQKLIVVKEEDSGVTAKYLLSLIPDINYSKGRYCRAVLDSFTNVGRKGDYCGLAVYTIPETGELIRVSRYENGEYCDGVYIFDPVFTDIEKNNELAFSYIEGISVYRINNNPITKAEDEVIYDLPEIIFRPKDGKHINRGSYENDNVLIDHWGGVGGDFGRYATGHDSHPDPQDRGDMSGGGGSGRGDGRNDTDNGSGAPMSRKIFKNSTLTSTQWKMLESKIEEILEDCMGANLYRKLTEKLGDNKRIVVRFDENASGNFTFNGEYSILTFNPDKRSENLFHEMFHICQAYGEVPESYKAAGLNLEFEVYLAQFRYMENTTPGFYESKYYEEYIKHPMGRSVDDLSKFLDKHGYLKDGESEKKYKEHISVRMVDAFRNHSNGVYNEEKYPFDASRVGGMNFKNFQELAKDC